MRIVYKSKNPKVNIRNIGTLCCFFMLQSCYGIKLGKPNPRGQQQVEQTYKNEADTRARKSSSINNKTYHEKTQTPEIKNAPSGIVENAENKNSGKMDIEVNTEKFSSRAPGAKNFCLNNNFLGMSSELYSNKEFLKSVKNMSPKIIRYPGGTHADIWDWKKGGIKDQLPSFVTENPISELANLLSQKQLKEFNQGTIENLVEFSKVTNSTPIFQLNMITSNLEEQLEMLKHAFSLGLDVEYVELGNEHYFDQPHFKYVFPTAKDYVEVVSSWSTAIKKEFPNAKIAAIAIQDLQTGLNKEREGNWNQAFEGVDLPFVDAFAIHIYLGENQNRPDSGTYPNLNPEEVAKNLLQPFGLAKKVLSGKYMGFLPKNKEIWYTEFGLFPGKYSGGNNQIVGSWMHGLFTFNMSMVLLEDSRTTIACPHSLLGTPYFASVFVKDRVKYADALDSEPVHKNQLTAVGQSLQLIGRAFEAVDKVKPFQLENVSLAEIQIGNELKSIPLVRAWVLEGQKKKVLVVNLSDKNNRLNLSNVFISNVNKVSIEAEPLDLIYENLDLKNNSFDSEKVLIKPYSISLISSHSEH